MITPTPRAELPPAAATQRGCTPNRLYRVAGTNADRSTFRSWQPGGSIRARASQ